MAAARGRGAAAGGIGHGGPVWRQGQLQMPATSPMPAATPTTRFELRKALWHSVAGAGRHGAAHAARPEGPRPKRSALRGPEAGWAAAARAPRDVLQRPSPGPPQGPGARHSRAATWPGDTAAAAVLAWLIPQACPYISRRRGARLAQGQDRRAQRREGRYSRECLGHQPAGPDSGDYSQLRDRTAQRPPHPAGPLRGPPGEARDGRDH